MLERLMRWFFGYVKVTLKGFYPEQFMNLCQVRNLSLWKISSDQTGCHAYIRIKDYKQVKDIARKTKTVPYIQKRYGFPFFLRYVRKRMAYFIGIVLFCTLLFVMSRFIWDISIEGGECHTPEQMMTYLKDIGVYSGCKIAEIDCPYIETCMRRDFTDIGWVSAQIKGTRLIINMVETKVPILVSDQKKTKLTYGHIVASKDGIIQSIMVRRGIPKVSIGDVVQKGDILVSGLIPIMSDDGVVKEYKRVLSDADIQIKNVISYESSFPMKYEWKDFSGKSKKGTTVTLWGKKIFCVTPSNSYDHYDIISEVKTLKLVRNFYLPIQIKTTYCKEYNNVLDRYTKEEAKNKANQELMNYMTALKKHGSTIVDNQVVVKVGKEECKSQGIVEVIDSAWQYTSIDDSEWRNLEKDEHSGDNN